MKKSLAVLTLISLLALSSCASKQITMQEAKEIALKDAGTEESSVTFTTEKQDDLDYEFEFSSGDTSYSYEISSSGRIESKEKTTVQSQNPDTSESAQNSDDSLKDPSSGTSSQNNSQDSFQQSILSSGIGEAKALEIAYQKASVSPADAQYLSVKLEQDDGRSIYEIEFYVGNTEYNFEISASDGEILEYEQDAK